MPKKNKEKLEIVKSFLAIFFAKSTGHKDVKICTVHHINVPYKCCFIKMSLSRKKKSKLKIVTTTTTTTPTTTTTTTTLTVPWSGLRRRQKCGFLYKKCEFMRPELKRKTQTCFMT